MPIDRFLLVKSWGHSIWEDVDHVMGQLLIADLTNRDAIVYWSMESLYSESINTNAFELFFEPVSPYTIHDVVKPGYTFYPPVWNHGNVLAEDPEKMKLKDRDLKSMLSSNANVLVSDILVPVRAIIPFISKGHWAYGKTAHQIYRYLFDRYLKIKPEVRSRIQKYINANPDFRDEKPILGVHVKGNAIVNEVAQIYDLNEFYKPNIWQFISRYNVRHIFLITDSVKILNEYKRQYSRGDLLMYSDSKKRPLTERVAMVLMDHPNKRHKGVELIEDTMGVIVDTILASQCDFFIGNGYSSLSNTVLRLKDWADTNIKLLY